MDEVWEDISLPSLHHPTTTITTSSAAHSAFNEGLNLQDFLNNDSHPYPRLLPVPDHPTTPSAIAGDSGFLFSRRSPSQATVLSLKSGHLDHLQRSGKHFVSSSLCKKRTISENNNDSDGAGDRRHKRLMKNRESAARSRARRQSYTDELERKMAELKKENAKLRRQLEMVGFSAPSAVPSQLLRSRKGHSLNRTLTAPF